MKRNVVVVFFLLFISFPLSAQPQESKVLSAEALQEKIYLHTDKPYYYPGEMIWFSAYVNYKSPTLLGTLSKVMYVDLIKIDNVIIKSLILKIDSGRTEGNFKIPSDLFPGSFVIRAYTNWMNNYSVENFSYTPIKILNLNDIVEINTFDEINDCTDIEITFDKFSYHTRDKVKMTVSLIQPNDSTHIRLSVAVTDENQVKSIKGSKSILKDFLFERSPPIGMLSAFQYRIERGIGMSGTYLSKKGKREKATLSIVQNNFENVYIVNTNDYGDFSLHDLIFYDSMRFAIQGGKGKILLKTRELPEFPTKLPTLNVPLAERKPSQQILYYDTGKSILLHDVKIKASRLRPAAENTRQKIDFYITGKDIATYSNMAAAIQSKVPGYNLVYSDMHTYLVWLRGEYSKRGGPPIEPIVYLNNNEMVNVIGSETIGDRLALLDPALIDHIEAASTSNTGLGATGSLGVLFIYTKNGELSDSKSIPVFWIKGFHKPDTFYSTDYSNPLLQKKDTEDFRSTIYWNPKISLSATKNTVDLSFFTSDQNGKYTVIIEGVTHKSVPLRIVKTITVND